MSQGSFGGVGWFYLGTFSLKSGTLKVVLSNLANNNAVDADGVLIVGHVPPPQVQLGGRSSLVAGPVNNGTIAALDTTASRAGLGSPTSSGSGQPITAAGKSTPSAASTVSITGISPSAPPRVSYDQGSQQANRQLLNGLVDVVLPIVTGRVRVRQQVASDAIAAFAKVLIAGGQGGPV
jgi:hypothetical protein